MLYKYYVHALCAMPLLDMELIWITFHMFSLRVILRIIRVQYELLIFNILILKSTI